MREEPGRCQWRQVHERRGVQGAFEGRENRALRTRDAVRWSSKHDEQLDIVMKAISDRDPYVEGSRNKNWWRQVAAGMSSAMKHELRWGWVSLIFARIVVD